MGARHKLSAKIVQKLAKVDGRYGDGAGLYLRVQAGRPSWVFNIMRNGKRSEFSLGQYPAMDLANARVAADVKRAEVDAGLVIKKRDKLRFAEYAEDFIKEREPVWKNQVHKRQWRQTLSLEQNEDGTWKSGGYCEALRNKALADIDTDDILKILRPIWLEKAETANRLRARLEMVLAAAIAHKLRPAPNPATLKNHLEFLLPKRGKKEIEHHAAAAYGDVPKLYAALKAVRSTSALSVCFVILTACRTGEAIGADWSEVDMKEALWVVPSERMKSGREHVVPLSTEATDLLRFIGVKDSGLIFPGAKGQKLSQMALLMALRRTLPAGLRATVHGFRSSFRDWCGDATDFSRDDAEHQLAHVVGDGTERAYRRGTALERRRKMMQAWSDFVTGSANVPKNDT